MRYLNIQVHADWQIHCGPCPIRTHFPLNPTKPLLSCRNEVTFRIVLMTGRFPVSAGFEAILLKLQISAQKYNSPRENYT